MRGHTAKGGKSGVWGKGLGEQVNWSGDDGERVGGHSERRAGKRGASRGDTPRGRQTRTKGRRSSWNETQRWEKRKMEARGLKRRDWGEEKSKGLRREGTTEGQTRGDRGPNSKD